MIVSDQRAADIKFTAVSPTIDIGAVPHGFLFVAHMDISGAGKSLRVIVIAHIVTYRYHWEGLE